MSKKSPPDSSFQPLDLLSYSKSGPSTPFHIFIDFIMPQFVEQLSKRKQQLSSGKKDEIEKKLIEMENACVILRELEDDVNKEFKDLILQNLDFTFKERTEAAENFSKNECFVDTVNTAWKVVSMLNSRFSSIKEVSPDKLGSRSVKPSRFAKKLELNIENMMSESSTFQEILQVYNGLKDHEWKQNCLLCFSVFSQNSIIKKKALVHWWVGEGFLSCQTDEEKGNDLFQEFIDTGIIERVSKKRRRSLELCRMHPLIRYAVIRLAETKNFIGFHPNGNPTADFSDKKIKRGCLVITEEGYSSLRELTYGFRLKEENVETLFNVNEPYVDLREDSFSKMRNMKVLRLGRYYADLTKKVVEVDDTEFLIKGLKKMKNLRYLSLRGITRVTVLPDSICKLTNLVIVDLHGCHYLERLPEEIGSLTNLTWLDMSGCYLISHMPVGLSKLSKLQVLHGFWIGRQAKERTITPDFCTLATLARKLKYLKKLSINVDARCTDKKLLAEELNSLSEFEKLVSLLVAWSDIHKNDGEAGGSEGTAPKWSTSSGRKTTKHPESTKHAASLAKLELQFLPDPEMPHWVKLFNLEKLQKLYVRGGKLSQLHPVGCEKWKVSILRLLSLSELQMDWRKLRALFPDLKYVQKAKCPKLILFPCDENGEWASGEEETEHA
ncbi:disease resistance RPP13-like protein 4 [Corylus avellana]|uniref:disease resistance RPP13-like protein 4 n=1 Tax=Corylus avellana TaxID=13451 RepID=UPI00286BFF45|nr:disease resistance RPP13-like protein 4 [Corylus avellana]